MKKALWLVMIILGVWLYYDLHNQTPSMVFEFEDEAEGLILAMTEDFEKADLLYTAMLDAWGNTLMHKPVMKRNFYEPKEAIQFVRYYYEKDGTIKYLLSSKEQNHREIDKLSHHEGRAEEVFQNLNNFHQLFAEFVDLAVSPSGKFVDYQDHYRQIKTELKQLQYEWEYR